jgi:hypothetical protein
VPIGGEEPVLDAALDVMSVIMYEVLALAKK